MPDITELRSIRNESCVNEAMYSPFLGLMNYTDMNPGLWSSTTVNQAQTALLLYPSSGHTDWFGKTNLLSVMCVRGNMNSSMQQGVLMWQGTLSSSFDVRHNRGAGYQADIYDQYTEGWLRDDDVNDIVVRLVWKKN